MIELRNEAWVRQLIAEENPNYFQKYTDTLGVSLNDIFIIIPTLVTYPCIIIKSIAELQEILSQRTGLPKGNWVILSENRFISNEKYQMFLTINFDAFLKELVER